MEDACWCGCGPWGAVAPNSFAAYIAQRLEPLTLFTQAHKFTTMSESPEMYPLGRDEVESRR
jgi:hypothetical protein